MRAIVNVPHDAAGKVVPLIIHTEFDGGPGDGSQRQLKRRMMVDVGNIVPDLRLMASVGKAAFVMIS